jgi:ABC-2 type transport system ATP-binding protein
MSPEAYDIKSNIGVIMQNVAVFNELTVYENIDYFCGLYVPDKVTRRELVEEAIEFVGLKDFRRFYPSKLSGGLLRRLNIACGIAHRPKLILMDEPTVAVDPQSRNSILEGILKLNAQGATIVYTSHYMEEVEQICSRIVIMDKGRVIASGTRDELKSMIKAGEKITVEMIPLSSAMLDAIGKLPRVAWARYEQQTLSVSFAGGKDNLLTLLDYLRQQDLVFGRVYSELPTLNDVFLEFTGKELRE